MLRLIFALLLLPMTALAEPEFWVYEWPNTDFEKTSVASWSEFLDGGPPRDGIPALNDPSFHNIGDEQAIADNEPVITVEIEGQIPRAYPIRHLLWHEIVNDQIGDVPIAVTFCPLCNSGITFDRRVGDQVLTFGVSGKLRNSDMIMFDRETESWWQQAIGTGVVGEMTGVELQTLPSWMEGWADFKARNPNGLVMDQPRYPRNYGINPYANYDSRQLPYFNGTQVPPHDIPHLSRVVRVGDHAWPLTRLAALEEVHEAGVVLTWASGQVSALDTAKLSEARDVGSVRVRDEAGNDLAHDVMFAFAFHAFWPEGTWMLGD